MASEMSVAIVQEDGVQQEGSKRPSMFALILVDAQEDFCEPNGALAVKGGRALAERWNAMLAGNWDAVVVTQDWHPSDHVSFASQHAGAQPFTSQRAIQNPRNKDETISTTLWPDHCVADTDGAKLIPELEQKHITHRVLKGQDKRVECYSAFGPPFRNPAMGGSTLHDTLRQQGIRHVTVVGLAYDYCVKHTALDAKKLGYTVTVCEDATRAVDASEENLEAVRKELCEAGVIVTMEDGDQYYPCRERAWKRAAEMGVDLFGGHGLPERED